MPRGLALFRAILIAPFAAILGVLVGVHLFIPVGIIEWLLGITGEPFILPAQFIGAGLKLLHGKQVEVTDWADAKENLGASQFRMVPRERDAAGKRADRKPQMEEVQSGYDFPSPAEAELVPSDDPKLPPGLRVTNVTPNIVLGWDVDAKGEVAEDIRFVDPPRQPKKPTSTVAKPSDGRPTSRR